MNGRTCRSITRIMTHYQRESLSDVIMGRTSDPRARLTRCEPGRVPWVARAEERDEVSEVAERLFVTLEADGA
jgi:hypothetical protein